ncbi:MAG: hypothetical protein EBS49_01585 [Verrucomicrobia bacterium]|nr:hypothetical protein [Verrucomicrobiota bacterium]NBU68314.1 hypothetical protein [Verrucomicrobiota bacterium]
MNRFEANHPEKNFRKPRRPFPQEKEGMAPPRMEDLSSDRPVLRRQLYRAYRAWLAQLVKEQGDQIPGRDRMIRHLHRWDLRFSDEQTPELSTLLLQEAPVAMMAALGRACRDRRININVRMVLARDYRHYRAEAREMVEVRRSTDETMRKMEEEKLKARSRKVTEEYERAMAEEEAQQAEQEKEARRTWKQKLKRGWSLLKYKLGFQMPTAQLEELAGLVRADREDELMDRFYEMGGSVTRLAGPPPPWAELGDTWNEVDGEIWQVLDEETEEPRIIYIGHIFRDPVIRGKENPYFTPGWKPKSAPG